MWVATVEGISAAVLREVLEELPGEAEVWVNIDHGVIRKPVEQFAYSTARVMGAGLHGDALMLSIEEQDEEEGGGGLSSPTGGGGLRARRTALGLTRQELAQRAGCSMSLIEFLEHGYRSRGPKVGAIAKVLGCTVDELFELDAEGGG